MDYKIASETLSDGSKVYNVCLREIDSGRYGVVFPAVSERDAILFIDGLKALVETHTVETLTETD